MFLVSDTELRRLVPMRDAIAAVAEAFVAVSDGSADQPPRMAFSDGSGLAMMARRSPGEAAGDGAAFKLVTLRTQNRAAGLPTLHALVLWFDSEHGSPRLLIEGTSLTALRTGAASGVATDLLAAPEAATLAVIGAGAQAADQIRAVCAVRPIERVRIFSPGGASAPRLAALLAPELAGVELQSASSSAEATEGADVVCTATNAASPVVSAGAVAGRVHLNAVGSFRPEMRELPGELIEAAEILAVDQIEAAMSEAGELIAALESGARRPEEIRELGELLLAPPRAPSALTIFKSVGVAMQDWAICRLVNERISPGSAEIELRTDEGARVLGSSARSLAQKR